jgi:hypothetical protein
MLSCLQGKHTSTITARVNSFWRSNDGHAEPATLTNDGRTSSGFGSAIGCADASNNEGFSRNDGRSNSVPTTNDGRYSSSGARKGAALGIPPPADRVGGTHQSLKK